MRLNKFATWGVLPPPAGQPKPGPESLRAQVRRAANMNAKALLGVKHALVRLDPTNQRPDPAEPPSRAAWEIVGCLGQVRDALCDRHQANVDTVNAQLETASKSVCAEGACHVLADVDLDLVAELMEQFRQLDDTIDFETQRRLRLAELTYFEGVLLATLDDAQSP
jgi:hypothetical protein